MTNIEMYTVEEPGRESLETPEGIMWGIPLLLTVVTFGIAFFLCRMNQHATKLIKKVRDPVVELIPLENLGRVKEILCQIAILSDSDRVSLGVFHNGSKGSEDPPYRRMCVIEGYSAPGVSLLPELKEDIPVDIIMRELSPLMRGDGEIVVSIKDSTKGCHKYMSTRGVCKLWNQLLSTKGILSIHWCNPRKDMTIPRREGPEWFKLRGLIEELEGIIG